MTRLDFAGRVMIVSGGGRGIGRAHCLLLASRGAHVVVNDVGSDRDGLGHSRAPADSVVDEITRQGQSAVASYDSVATESGAGNIVRTALDAFGHIDGIIHNAGVCTIVPLLEQTEGSYRSTMSASLDGGYYLARAAWPHMVRQGHGKLLMTGSSVGMCGHEHNVPYGMAKAGLMGMVKCLALAGAPHGISVNLICVGAQTRLTKILFERLDASPEVNAVGDWWDKYLRPEQVAPLAAFLLHPECSENGEMYEVIGGRVSRYFVGVTQGYTSLHLTPEEVRDHFAEIRDRTHYDVFNSAAQHGEAYFQALVAAGAEPIGAAASGPIGGGNKTTAR